MAWFCIYTLNVDGLVEVASRRFALPRSIRSLSALGEDELPSDPELACAHLNGNFNVDSVAAGQEDFAADVLVGLADAAEAGHRAVSARAPITGGGAALLDAGVLRRHEGGDPRAFLCTRKWPI